MHDPPGVQASVARKLAAETVKHSRYSSHCHVQMHSCLARDQIAKQGEEEQYSLLEGDGSLDIRLQPLPLDSLGIHQAILCQVQALPLDDELHTHSGHQT